MVSPLSPIIADLVLLDLETRALESFGIEVPFYVRYVPFYVRYVDDIATAIHHT